MFMTFDNQIIADNKCAMVNQYLWFCVVYVQQFVKSVKKKFFTGEG
jgi:hypothetical protein